MPQNGKKKNGKSKTSSNTTVSFESLGMDTTPKRMSGSPFGLISGPGGVFKGIQTGAKAIKAFRAGKGSYISRAKNILSNAFKGSMESKAVPKGYKGLKGGTVSMKGTVATRAGGVPRNVGPSMIPKTTFKPNIGPVAGVLTGAYAGSTAYHYLKGGPKSKNVPEGYKAPTKGGATQGPGSDFGYDTVAGNRASVKEKAAPLNPSNNNNQFKSFMNFGKPSISTGSSPTYSSIVKPVTGGGSVSSSKSSGSSSSGLGKSKKVNVSRTGGTTTKTKTKTVRRPAGGGFNVNINIGGGKGQSERTKRVQLRQAGRTARAKDRQAKRTERKKMKK